MMTDIRFLANWYRWHISTSFSDFPRHHQHRLLRMTTHSTQHTAHNGTQWGSELAWRENQEGNWSRKNNKKQQLRHWGSHHRQRKSTHILNKGSSAYERTDSDCPAFIDTYFFHGGLLRQPLDLFGIKKAKFFGWENGTTESKGVRAEQPFYKVKNQKHVYLTRAPCLASLSRNVSERIEYFWFFFLQAQRVHGYTDGVHRGSLSSRISCEYGDVVIGRSSSRGSRSPGHSQWDDTCQGIGATAFGSDSWLCTEKTEDKKIT